MFPMAGGNSGCVLHDQVPDLLGVPVREKRCKVVSSSMLQSRQSKSCARPILDNLSFVGSLSRMTIQTRRLKRGIAPLYQTKGDQWTTGERARIASQADLVEKLLD